MSASKSAKQRMPHAGKFKPYIQSLQTAQIVHLYTKKPSIPSSEAGIASGVEEPSGAAGTTTEAA